MLPAVITVKGLPTPSTMVGSTVCAGVGVYRCGLGTPRQSLQRLAHINYSFSPVDVLALGSETITIPDSLSPISHLRELTNIPMRLMSDQLKVMQQTQAQVWAPALCTSSFCDWPKKEWVTISIRQNCYLCWWLPQLYSVRLHEFLPSPTWHRESPMIYSMHSSLTPSPAYLEWQNNLQDNLGSISMSYTPLLQYLSHRAVIFCLHICLCHLTVRSYGD